MIADFLILKRVVSDWIDAHLDHTCIFDREDQTPWILAIAEANSELGRPVYWIEGPPSAERIAIEVFDVFGALLRERCGVELERIEVWETPSCSAQVDRHAAD